MFFRQKKEEKGGKEEEVQEGMEMEKGDKKMRDEKMGDCPHNSDAQAQKSHSPGSRHMKRGSKIGGVGQDRYFSAQGKALLLQTAVL